MGPRNRRHPAAGQKILNGLFAGLKNKIAFCLVIVPDNAYIPLIDFGPDHQAAASPALLAWQSAFRPSKQSKN
jgi:hypothetical protein